MQCKNHIKSSRNMPAAFPYFFSSKISLVPESRSCSIRLLGVYMPSMIETIVTATITIRNAFAALSPAARAISSRSS